MKEVQLRIENESGRRSVVLQDELTIGRTDAARIVLDDAGLSRRNTTFFRDGDEIFVVDENSTNGTFLNGERLGASPVRVYDGDVLRIGSETRISVDIRDASSVAVAAATPVKTETTRPKVVPKTAAQPKSADSSKTLLIAAGVSTMLILVLGGVALVIASRYSGTTTIEPPKNAVAVRLIPVRVMDPLGGEDPDDTEDLIASWETEEKELDVSTVRDVKAAPSDVAGEDESELNVTSAFLAEQKAKAFGPRNEPQGISPAGLNVPAELRGDGVIKQKAKLAQMKDTGYQQPMDFSDLAQKRLSKELIEMPMATTSFYLEVGGSASTEAFQAFSFQAGDTPIMQGSPKYQSLAGIAAKFGLDLNNPDDRKQIRMRLLRMFNQRAKPVLKELADAYFQKFGRPLRVTSLTRSMDYQIGLNKTNANSFKVRGEGSLPPHTSGCAFDLARKHMGVSEQNFVMAKLAEMERARRLDALIEYGTNACFHIFIYFDGIAPNM